jgi:ribose/xylose/arabinose/galactoside ABC-type transport system permease subunit
MTTGLSSGGTSGSARTGAPGFSLMNLFRNLPMLPVVILAAILLSLTVEGFSSAANAQNIMRQLPVILIAVSAETLVLLIGGIDLSVGAIIGLASVCGAFTMHATDSVFLGLMACIAVGVAVGAINGIGIAVFGIQPFIMTFGTMLTARALAFLITGGRSVGRLPKPLLEAGRMDVLGIPLIFILALCVCGVIGFMLSRTSFGQKIYLVGSNPRAATFSGINVKRLTFTIYLLSGALCGLAAFVFMMRLGSASPTAGDPLLLQIIGAVVLGGTTLTGGEGGILRSMTGALLIAMIVKSLEILGAQFWDQMIVIGVLTALGSALGSWLGRRRISGSTRKSTPGPEPGDLARTQGGPEPP